MHETVIITLGYVSILRVSFHRIITVRTALSTLFFGRYRKSQIQNIIKILKKLNPIKSCLSIPEQKLLLMGP